MPIEQADLEAFVSPGRVAAVGVRGRLAEGERVWFCRWRQIGLSFKGSRKRVGQTVARLSRLLVGFVFNQTTNG